MRSFFLILCALSCGIWIGCDTKDAPPKIVAKPVENHDHSHAHGPNGGIAFTLSGAEFKVEAITNKTNDLVQVFFLDHDAKINQPIKAEKITVHTDKLGGKSFDLKPVNPDANGLAAEFSLEDKDLKSITGLKPTMEVTIDGKTYSGAMDFH